LLVFADDWAVHPSSSQLLVRQMLPDRPVLWVNTIGTRRPRPTFADAAKIVRTLCQWCRGSRSPADRNNPIVIHPPMLPTFASRLARATNAKLIAGSVNRAIARHLPASPTVLCSVPLAADLVGRVNAKRWIYYCVDDFASWPGLDGATLQKMEADLLQGVDDVVAVSPLLMRRAEQAGHQPTLLTHGVDLSTWKRDLSELPDHPVLQRVAQLPGPRAIYWGLVDDRMDWRLVDQLTEHFSGTVVLAGPQQMNEHEPATHSRLVMPGPIPHELLPHLGKLADVLIMPYRDCAVTRAMQPLKLMEYLASSRPVVCTDLPAITGWSDCCDIVDRSRFVERVTQRAGHPLPADQSHNRNQRLPDETWAAKAAMLARLIDQSEPRLMQRTSARAA
jgi:hypothetical protein